MLVEYSSESLRYLILVADISEIMHGYIFAKNYTFHKFQLFLEKYFVQV